MFLHQGIDIPINSINTVASATNLKAVSNVQIPTHCIATIPTKQTFKCVADTPGTLAVKKDEITTIQNPQLAMLPKVHLKGEVKPVQVLLTLVNLS